MPTSSSANTVFWRSDAFVGLAVVIAVLLLNQVTDLFGTLERRFYDFGSTSTTRMPSERITIVAIDDASIATIGRWPWPRDVHADLIDRLTGAGAKTIGHTAFFFEPQTDRGLAYLRRIKALVQPPPGSDRTPEQRLDPLLGVIDEAEAALDTDGKLATSIARSGRVILPSVYRLGEPLGRTDQPLPSYALKSTVANLPGFALPALSGQQPLETLGTQAAGIGHLNQTPDADGYLRREPLLINYYGTAVPSMALVLAAHSLNLGRDDIEPDPAASVLRVGKLKVKVSPEAFMFAQFYRDRDGKPPFVIDSFADVLSGKVPPNRFAGKIVLIGATAAGLGATFPAPVSPALTPVEYLAHATSSLLGEHFIMQPPWTLWATMGAVLLTAAYLVMLLPRLKAGAGALTTGLLFATWISLEFALLSRAFLWVELVLPASLLLIGHLALTTKRFLITEAGKQRSDEESAETNRMMGLAFQGQGQLDMAFDRFRRVPSSPAVLDNLSHLALDFERKRQFNKAQAVYEHMHRLNPAHPGLHAKLDKVRSLAQTVILGGGPAHAGGTLLLADGAVEKPMLGRYRIDKELGKGAMGVVYQGRDPTIGRIVAIKTLALSEEFEGDALTDARTRFFREAETAGRLQHQNIVTIFDAGEEHDLAYIAMEYLKGRDLTVYCREGQLLPVPQVVSIVARVARALAYAHVQNVVHRDIKPANIMYEPTTDTVKVTDFGIARITDSSRTRTGLVLGTPSYMSPEQIAGHKVDGRSDLFSLGVMLFQLLTGVLPFRGESMAELMYKIANEEAPDVRQLRHDLPLRLATVVARSLRKQPDARYQDGESMAADLVATLSGTDPEAPLETAAGMPSATLTFEETHLMEQHEGKGRDNTAIQPPRRR